MSELKIMLGKVLSELSGDAKVRIQVIGVRVIDIKLLSVVYSISSICGVYLEKKM